MRSLLQLPQQPAVGAFLLFSLDKNSATDASSFAHTVRVSVFALLFDEMAQGIVSDLVTSQFFDVPVGLSSFSMRAGRG